MAELSFLMRRPETPLQALQIMFKDMAVLEAEQVTLLELTAPDLLGEADRAWSWRVQKGAPHLCESNGTQYLRTPSGGLREASRAERTALTHGVVVWSEDYGGFLVALDTGENEADACLIEYCLSMLDQPAEN